VISFGRVIIAHREATLKLMATGIRRQSMVTMLILPPTMSGGPVLTPGRQDPRMTRDYDERDFELERPGNEGNEGGDEDRGGESDRDRRQKLDTFEKMKVWQEAHQLTLKVFAATPRLPESQQAGLAMQMEAAAVGVPKSIAEGFKRRGPRNKAHFYNIAQSSLESLRYYFILCRDLGYDIGYEDLAYRGDQIARMLDGLIRSMLR
jgi:four helix bundle protein